MALCPWRWYQTPGLKFCQKCTGAGFAAKKGIDQFIRIRQSEAVWKNCLSGLWVTESIEQNHKITRVGVGGPAGS